MHCIRLLNHAGPIVTYYKRTVALYELIRAIQSHHGGSHFPPSLLHSHILDSFPLHDAPLLCTVKYFTEISAKLNVKNLLEFQLTTVWREKKHAEEKQTR